MELQGDRKLVHVYKLYRRLCPLCMRLRRCKGEFEGVKVGGVWVCWECKEKIVEKKC